MLGSDTSFSYPLSVERFMLSAVATSSCVFERLFRKNFILVLNNIANFLKFFLTRIKIMTNFSSQFLIKNMAKIQRNFEMTRKK